MQLSTDSDLLKSTSLSPKRTPFFDKEASSEDEAGNDGDDDEDKHANQSGRMTASIKTPKGNKVSAITPRMSQLVGNQPTKSIITSYFGDLDLLDNQNAFDKVFGKNPTVVGIRPASEHNMTCMNRVRHYADNYLLDVFLDACRQDYVGKLDTNARKKLVHEICKNISDLQQVN